jgi:hypothetical protein
MSPFGKILVSKDALASLLSTKLGVDTSSAVPKVWLAKAKEAWVADTANAGKCFTHHFLKSNKAIAACKFGAQCRAEPHG